MSKKKLFCVVESGPEPYILVAMARSREEVVEIGETISFYFGKECVKEVDGKAITFSADVTINKTIVR